MNGSSGLICIDPGLRGCGVAYFEGTRLVRADYVKNPASGRGYFAHAKMGLTVEIWARDAVGARPMPTVLVEHPRIYPGAPNKDLNDLLDVVAVGAACATNLQEQYVGKPSETVYPSEWKGTVKKSVMTARIKAALTPDELKVCGFTNKSDDSDLLDAVGIGLWRLGRLNKKLFPGATP